MAHLGWVAFLVTWLAGGVGLAGPLLLAALGEIFAERAGVVNVGIEGTILLGALASFLVAYATGDAWIGLLAAAVAGLLASLPLVWMYVWAQANQVVVGITFNLLAVGLSSYLYRALLGGGALDATIPMLGDVPLPGLASLPLVGPLLFRHPAPFYLTALLALLAGHVLFRTRLGLDLRAVGENPRAAAAAGIDVRRMRALGVLVGGAASGLAGAYLMLCQIGVFRDNIVSGHGFIALAIVILGRWNPYAAAVAALAFGAADALPISLQMLDLGVAPQLLLAMPYVLAALAMSGLFGRVAQPAALMARHDEA